MRRVCRRLLGAVALFAVAGCAGFGAGVKDAPSRLQVDSLIGGYLSVDALESAPENFAKANVLGGGKGSSLLDFDIWPLFGVGVGVEGVRARILNFEAALGTPMGTPKSTNSPKSKPPTSDAVARLLAELGR